MSTNSDLAFKGLSDLSNLLASGETSSAEVTRQQLDRISELDSRLNAYITVLADEALAQARGADERRQQGEHLPLLGVPIALKDLYETAGVRTTGGSRLMVDNVPDRDATTVSLLQRAGTVLLGKTNMMEFAYGYPHPDYGETSNPWDLRRTAGGSSGGSAAAVAAGMTYAGLGSDTGGSIRSPAAYCGIVGLKPTYGAVSRRGIIPLSWSLDHAGPLTRTVSDAAMIFDALAGYDPQDPASTRTADETAAGAIDEAPETVRIGIIEELFERHVEPSVATITRKAVEQLQHLNWQVETVELSTAHLVAPVIMPILQAEATSYHWETLSDSEKRGAYGSDIRENLLLGATVLAKDYLAAQRLRRQMAEEVSELLARFDALVFPTQPITAPPLDAYHVDDGPDEDVLDVEIGHTGLANLTGHPAVSVPCGFTEEGLPVGLQFTGRLFDERTILQLAHAYESSTSWHRMRPSL